MIVTHNNNILVLLLILEVIIDDEQRKKEKKKILLRPKNIIILDHQTEEKIIIGVQEVGNDAPSPLQSTVLAWSIELPHTHAHYDYAMDGMVKGAFLLKEER